MLPKVSASKPQSGDDCQGCGKSSPMPGFVKHEQMTTLQRLSSCVAAGVVVGLLALGEGMPSTLRMQALRLLSWLCITAGVSALAGGKGAPLHNVRHNSCPGPAGAVPHPGRNAMFRLCITANVSALTVVKVAPS